MATVTGLTKERMLEIEAASVISGEVDTSGDLVLETHDGTLINAGHVVGPPSPNLADASTTVKGLIEIGTDVEYLTGSATTLAVTPSSARLGNTYTGTIAAGWSTGRPTVTLHAGQSYSGDIVGVRLPSNLDDSIIAGADVIMARSNSGIWVIITSYADRPRFMRQIPCSLEPGSGFVLYSDGITTDLDHRYGEGPAQFGGAAVLADSTRAGKFYATCTSTGIVTLEGLVARVAGAPAVNAIIGRFPVELAPARNQTFNVYTNAGTGAVAVCTDGTIRYVMGGTSFFGLSNIRFRSAASVASGIATFQPLSLLSGWASLATAAWTGEPNLQTHTVGYTIDADKVAIFEGIVTATVAKAAAADITAAIPGLTPRVGCHYPATSGAGFAYWRISGSAGAGGIGTIANTGVAFSIGQFMSLSQGLWLDSSSTTTIRNGPSGASSWQSYAPASWAEASFAKTPDGLVIAGGLWNGGTIGTAMTYIPDNWRPRFCELVSLVSNGAIGRMDIGQPALANYGQQGVTISIGSTTWVSLDGLTWPAYR